MREVEKDPLGHIVIGDALNVNMPSTDTIILYNILEHVDEPLVLLSKAIRVARKNVLINVPLRNPELWRLGLVEYHQLDKTHKHCGFSIDEVLRMVVLAGGRPTKAVLHGRVDATSLISLWKSKFVIYIYI